MRTSASPSFGTGRGTSSSFKTSHPPGAWTRIAFISASLQYAVAGRGGSAPSLSPATAETRSFFSSDVPSSRLSRNQLPGSNVTSNRTAPGKRISTPEHRLGEVVGRQKDGPERNPKPMRSFRLSVGIATVVAAAAFGMILTGSLHITPTISAAKTPAPVAASAAATAPSPGVKAVTLPSFSDVADNVLNSVVAITSREIVQTS